MSRRTPIEELRDEESQLDSPRRRSSRIAATIVTRRASATEEPVTKMARSKRLSLSQEPDEDSKSFQTGRSTPNKRTTRSESKSPITLSGMSESEGVPMKRTRSRGSISSLVDESQKQERASSPAVNKTRSRVTRSASTSPKSEKASKVSTPRQATRASTSSPSSEIANPPRIRGRRPSITEKIVPMQAIEEGELKKEIIESENGDSPTQKRNENVDLNEEATDDILSKKKKAVVLQKLQTITEKSFTEETEILGDSKSKECVTEANENEPNNTEIVNVEANNTERSMCDSPPHTNAKVSKYCLSLKKPQQTQKQSNELIQEASKPINVEDKITESSFESFTLHLDTTVSDSSLENVKYRTSLEKLPVVKSPDKTNLNNSGSSDKENQVQVKLTNTQDVLEIENMIKKQPIVLTTNLNLTFSPTANRSIELGKNENNIPRKSRGLDGSFFEPMDVDECSSDIEIIELDVQKAKSKQSPDVTKSPKKKSQDKTPERNSPKVLTTNIKNSPKKLKDSENEDLSGKSNTEGSLTPQKKTLGTSILPISEKKLNSPDPVKDSRTSLKTDIKHVDLENLTETGFKKTLNDSQSSKLSHSTRSSTHLESSLMEDDDGVNYIEKLPTLESSITGKAFDASKLQLDKNTKTLLESSLKESNEEIIFEVDENKLNKKTNLESPTSNPPESQGEKSGDKSCSPKSMDLPIIENSENEGADKLESSMKQIPKENLNKSESSILQSSTTKLDNTVNDKADEIFEISENNVFEMNVTPNSPKNKRSSPTETNKPVTPIRKSIRLLDKSQNDGKSSFVNSTPKEKTVKQGGIENTLIHDVVDNVSPSITEKKKQNSPSENNTIEDQINLVEENSNSNEDLSIHLSPNKLEDRTSTDILQKSTTSLNKSSKNTSKQSISITNSNNDEVIQFASSNKDEFEKENTSDNTTEKRRIETQKLNKSLEPVNKITPKKERNYKRNKSDSHEAKKNHNTNPNNCSFMSSDAEDSLNEKIDNLIANQAQEDSDSSCESVVHYLDDMAEEGEEDTPSEGSNDIIDEGESIGSTEDEVDSDDTYDGSDSFIDDEQFQNELLSGDEYDLEQEKVPKSKKKRSRIIELSDSEDEKEPTPLITINENVGNKQEVKTKENILALKNGIDEDSDLEKMSTRPYCGLTPPSVVSVTDSLSETDKVEIDEGSSDVIINNEDNLKSLEELQPKAKKSTQPPARNTKRDNLSAIFTPNNSILEDNTESSNRKRLSSITVHESIKLKDVQEGNISDRISKVVDAFCSSVKDGSDPSGDISLNISVEYLNVPSSNSTAIDAAGKNDKLEEYKDDQLQTVPESEVKQIEKKNKRKGKQQLNETKVKGVKRKSVINTTINTTLDALDMSDDLDSELSSKYVSNNSSHSFVYFATDSEEHSEGSAAAFIDPITVKSTKSKLDKKQKNAKKVEVDNTIIKEKNKTGKKRKQNDSDVKTKLMRDAKILMELQPQTRMSLRNTTNSKISNESDVLSDDVFIVSKSANKNKTSRKRAAVDIVVDEVNELSIPDKRSMAKGESSKLREEKIDSKFQYFPSKILQSLTTKKLKIPIDVVPNEPKKFKKPKLVPSTTMSITSWKTDVVDSHIMPSSSSSQLRPAKSTKYDLTVFHEKDFKNRTLFNPKRVGRVDMKDFLKKNQKN